MKLEKLFYALAVTVILILTLNYYVNQQPKTITKENKQLRTIQEDSAIIFINETTEYEQYFCNIEDCLDRLKLLFENQSVICLFYNADPELIDYLAKNSKSFKLYLDKVAENKSFNVNVTFISYKFGIFHAKICLVENITVIQSFNPTKKNAFYDVNDQFIIHSENITKFLKKTITEENLKSRKPFKIKTNKICITNSNIENLILENINNKTKFMLYTLTLESIANALESYNSEGLRSTYNNKYSKFPNNTITFKNKIGQLHLKVFFNENSVISGSFNPTKSATLYNYEISIMVNDTTLAKKYHNFYNFLKELTQNEENLAKVKEFLIKYNITISRKEYDVLIRNNKKYYNFTNEKGIYYIAFVPLKEIK
ncbi:MAG: phospholipase D-like domain-containing protein [Candidatus Woesearchaeota archaeon]